MGLVKRTYVDGETVITADNLNDIQDEIIQNASDISTKGTYSKPSGGIPSTDMTTDVQTSLGKADTAYQKPSGGIPSTDLASAVQTSLGKADTALQSSDIDNTLTVSGKAADAKKTGDEISGVKNTLNYKADCGTVGFNICNESFVAGTFVGGVIVPSDSRIVNKIPIPVEPNTTYYFNCPYPAYIMDVDAYSNWTQQNTRSVGGNKTFSTGAFAKYIFISPLDTYGSTYNNDICLNYPQTDTNIEPHDGQYVPYGYKGNYRDLLNIKREVSNISAGYVTKETEFTEFPDNIPIPINNIGYVKLDGSIGSSSAGQWQYSDFIPVSEGVNVTYDAMGATTVATLSFYTDASNSSVISASNVVAPVNNTVVSGTVTTPATAHYVRFCAFLPSANSTSMASYDGYRELKEVVEIVKNFRNTNANPWRGKSVGFLGDSITYGAYTPADGGEMTRTDRPYCVVACDKIGATCLNYGMSGTSISGTSTQSPNSSFTHRYSSMSNNLDLIVVFGGTNDYGTGVPLGTIADTTDISFYGAMDVLCNGLINKYPSKRIVFITPLLRNFAQSAQGHGEDENELGYTLNDIRQAIIDVAQGKYGLAVISGKELGISPFNSTWRATYIYDGIHPNPIGHEAIGTNLSHILSGI